MANETIITSNIQVKGLSELKQAREAYEGLTKAAAGHVSGSFAEGMTKDVKSAISEVRKLSEMVKSLNESGSSSNGFSKMREQMNQSVSAADKLNSSLRESATYTERVVSASDKTAAAQRKAAEASEKASTAQQRASQGSPMATQNASRIAESASKTESSWGKIKGSIKDSFAMFSVGMLGMTAVTSAVDGIKSAFKGGYDTIKERQAGQAMWATSIQDAHSGISGKQLNTQSASANRMMMATAIKAGNDYTQANQMAKQIYSSDAGVYSGNLNKTNAVVRGMFNIQDANALNTQEMERFTTAVGNIGDTGKMSGTIAKSLNFLDGKITRNMREEYKKETGKTLGKTKSGAWDYSQISAETAYRAIDKYGNSGSVGKASERINSTLGGVIRAGKSAINNGMADFETQFATRVNKAFGGKGGIIGKLSGIFTNSKLIESTAKGAGSKLSALAIDIGKFGKAVYGVGKDIAPYAKQFGSGFSKGFVGELKSLGKGVKTAYDDVKGIGSKIKDKLSGILPKGALSDFGKIAGKVSAVVLAIRGFSKLPGMSKLTSAAFAPAMAVLKKLPLVGTSLSGFVSKILGVHNTEDTASTKMMGAADKMNAAADKMNGAGGQTLGATGGSSSGAAGVYKEGMTRAEYRAALQSTGSRSSGLIAKGEQLLGESGTRVAANASWLTKLKGNSLIKLGTIGEKIGGSTLGRMGSGLVSGLSSAKSFLSKGMPGMNALFAGLDVVNALGSTKSGSLKRHKQVGSAVGGGVGATVGGALGSALGPVGTIAGGVAGQWVGSKLGSVVGGLFGGSKTSKKKVTASQMAKQAAVQVELDNQAKTIVQGGGAKTSKIAKTQLRALSTATSTKSRSAQKYAAQATDSLQSGDYKAYQKQTAKAAAATAKYYDSRAKTAEKQAKSDLTAYTKAKKAAKKNPTDPYAAGKADRAEAKYRKSKKKATSASKKATKADKASSALGNKATANERKHAKAAKATGKEVSKNAKKEKAASAAAERADKKRMKGMANLTKASKKSEKGFSSLTKAQQKEWKKQTKSLKAEKAKQTKLAKSANAKVKAAQKKASKDIAKADKSAAKAMSKNYKTSSKQISKAIKSGMKTAASQAKSGAKKISSNVKSGLKNVGKGAKSSFKTLTSSVKSGMRKAQTTAKSGAKKISTSIKSGLKSVKTVGRTSFNGLTSSVKSGLNRAKSAARSGAKGISNAVKSGLRTMSSGAKSQFNRLSSAARSGMNKVSSAIKSGLSKANSTMSSAFSKMASTANRATSRIAASMSKIGSAATAAASKVRSLQSAISGLKSKTVTITANVKGKGSGKLATGTPGASQAFNHLAAGTPGFHLANGWARNGGVKAGSYVVNDSKSGHWLEAFKTKAGLIGIFPPSRNLRVHLDEGDQVLNGNDTHKMFPHLATGTPGAKTVVTAPPTAKAAPVINITINVSGVENSLMPQKIANAMGEKLSMIFPKLEY